MFSSVTRHMSEAVRDTSKLISQLLA